MVPWMGEKPPHYYKYNITNNGTDIYTQGLRVELNLLGGDWHSSLNQRYQLSHNASRLGIVFYFVLNE